MFSVCGVMFNSFLFQLPYTFDFLFISILCACATGKRTPCYNVNAFNRIHRSNAFLTFCHFLCRNFMWNVHLPVKYIYTIQMCTEYLKLKRWFHSIIRTNWTLFFCCYPKNVNFFHIPPFPFLLFWSLAFCLFQPVLVFFFLSPKCHAVKHTVKASIQSEFLNRFWSPCPAVRVCVFLFRFFSLLLCFYIYGGFSAFQ